MPNENICYLYSEESKELTEQFINNSKSEGISFIPFSANGVFPDIDTEKIDHIMVSGGIEEIKKVISFAKEKGLSVGIVPLTGQEKISDIFDIPGDPADAFELALSISDKKIDLFYCNDIPVLNDVRIGDTAALKEYEYKFQNFSILQRLWMLWKAFRKNKLRQYRFSIKTEKEEQVTISAVGMIGLDYNNSSWIAERLSEKLSASDGQHLLLILSPQSLFQYFISSPLTLLFQKWRGEKLPKSCGYIKSNRVELECKEQVSVVVDDTEPRQLPVVLETQSEALALSVGDKFWERQTAPKTDRSSIKIDNIPKDEVTIDYLSKGLPLFKHASKEQYAALFSSLREEGSISTTFVILLTIATVIATLGLFINSSSVIIGAMILAPLMQPIVSLSMGVLRQDGTLTKNSIKTIVIGIVLTLVTAMFFAYFAPIREMTNEMTSRLSPTILDMMIAIASGIAAAYVKNNEKISASIAGVAIAVALVPPLAVAGIGIGWFDWHIFSNAFLLFLTNLIGIVFAAALTFLVLGFAPISVAKKGIATWSFIAVLIAIPLYHSFETMSEVSAVKSALLHVKFDIDGREIYLSKVEYQPKGKTVEIRCEVITDSKLQKDQRDYLKNMIEKVVGKPTAVIATFRYRL